MNRVEHDVVIDDLDVVTIVRTDPAMCLPTRVLVGSGMMRVERDGKVEDDGRISGRASRLLAALREVPVVLMDAEGRFCDGAFVVVGVRDF